MKKNVLILAVLFCGSLAFAACEDDDNVSLSTDSVVAQSFSAKYPTVASVSWEKENGYMKAEFYIDSFEAEAWFDSQGNWIMTETDVSYNALPQAVKTAFEAGSYVTWVIDDVDKFEFPSAATYYVIEVEQGSQDVDLYYYADGTLFKTLLNGVEIASETSTGTGTDTTTGTGGDTTGTGGDTTGTGGDTTGTGGGTEGSGSTGSTTITGTITDLIQTMYPGATILEIDRGAFGYEVEIRHENIEKDVKFDTEGNWLYTEWEITTSQVPSVVMTALKATSYASYRIDDVHIIEKASGVYYEFELEQGNREVTILIKEDGTVQ